MSIIGTYLPEVWEGSVRMVFENEGEHSSQWATIVPIAQQTVCAWETFQKWVRQTEIHTDRRGGLTSDTRTGANQRAGKGES